MKAIVSVFAKDSKGITAYVSSLLAEKEINILDISQTLMQEFFAMIMLVDLAGQSARLTSCRIFCMRKAKNARSTSISSVRTYLKRCTESEVSGYELFTQQQ